LDKVSVFGLGRLGLVIAVSFAKHGYEVTGIDVDSGLVESLSRGEATFYEPNLAEYVKFALETKKFTITRDHTTNSHSDLAYIAVGTPTRIDDSIDLTYVEEASRMIGRSLRDARQYQLVIVKSTVLPGTARNVVKPILENESGKVVGKDFSLCSNPEFLREGNAIHDTEFPDRIIIGSDDASAMDRLEKFCRSFHGDRLPPIVKTSFENAELTKYANNAFLATKVSFINSIASIAERTPHADVKAVAKGIGFDERIGPEFLNAGFGWGGSCFPKDLAALLSFGRQLGREPELINAVVATNKKQAEKATDFARQALGSLEKKRIAVLGLAFKPETDDLRGAVSILVINNLLNSGAAVTVWDPLAIKQARRILGNSVRYATDALDCLEEAECCILVTEWPEFKNLKPRTFVEKMHKPTLIDGRRIYDPDEFRRAGIRLHAIGLGPEAEHNSCHLSDSNMQGNR
jgi:UDPglucose 6-dehydrogenase